jgi:uncharacterized membrane protein YgdD (TMEM256/DUF423 family)
VDKFESPKQVQSMNVLAMRIAAVLGVTGVALGAFGAHLLKKFFATQVDGADRSGWWQTGVQYQVWHALFLLAVAALAPQLRHPQRTAWLTTAGVLLFSGSLYVMALTGIRGLGAITPLGGVAFLVAWASLLWRR